MAQMDGPRLAAKSRTAKHLIVFLHGYGSDGEDLIALGRQWQAFMPDAAFASPNAPEACVQVPGGRQWFGLTMRDPGERWAGVNKAQGALDAFLDAELARHGLDDSKLALVGFSQGTMMALHAGLRRARAPAAILGYSGELVAPEHLEQLAAQKTGRAPSIMLVHGAEDDVIPAEAMFVSAEALAGAGIPCQWHFSPALGHGIDAGGLRHGGLFLANALRIRIDPTLRAKL